jgi:hypothetical protein
MIFDQNKLPAHSACVPQNSEWIFRVVKHVNKQAGVEGFVGKGQVVSVEREAGYSAVWPRKYFYALDVKSRRPLTQDRGQFSIAASHI